MLVHLDTIPIGVGRVGEKRKQLNDDWTGDLHSVRYFGVFC